MNSITNKNIPSLAPSFEVSLLFSSSFSSSAYFSFLFIPVVCLIAIWVGGRLSLSYILSIHIYTINIKKIIPSALNKHNISIKGIMWVQWNITTSSYIKTFLTIFFFFVTRIQKIYYPMLIWSFFKWWLYT